MIRTPIIALLAGIAIARGAEPIFIPVKIDGPVHDPAKHAYWYGPFSESCSVADFDGDGDPDIAAGETLRLRYRLIVHDGDTPRELIGSECATWQ